MLNLIVEHTTISLHTCDWIYPLAIDMFNLKKPLMDNRLHMISLNLDDGRSNGRKRGIFHNLLVVIVTLYAFLFA
jgi:hypothetical protein